MKPGALSRIFGLRGVSLGGAVPRSLLGEVEYAFAHPIPFETWMFLQFDKRAREVWKDRLGLSSKEYSYTYLSLYRPLTIVQREFDRAAGAGNVAIFNVDAPREKGGSLRPTGVVWSKVPLPMDVIESYELSVPAEHWHRALAQAILATPRGTVEIGVGARTDRPELYVIFKNPRGLWQVSYFDQRGPTGHFDHEDLTTAIRETLGSKTGLQIVNGVLDDWAQDFDQEMLDWMATNYRRSV